VIVIVIISNACKGHRAQPRADGARETAVILHNRHQQLGSHGIMLSVGAEKALPTLGHADCTMHPVVLDDPLDSLPARTSAEPSSNG